MDPGPVCLRRWRSAGARLVLGELGLRVDLPTEELARWLPHLCTHYARELPLDDEGLRETWRCAIAELHAEAHG